MEPTLYISNGKIDISDAGINYWAKKLKCSPSDLKKATNAIGSTYNALILYMEMNQLINKD
jgi:hypothetical protein